MSDNLRQYRAIRAALTQGYPEVLLAHVALPRLVLVMDGSVVGRGCIARMIHVVYKGRALPLVWLVRQGKHGPFPEDLPIAVDEQGQELLPPGAQGVVLGDGACEAPPSSTRVGVWLGLHGPARKSPHGPVGRGALPG